MRKLLVFAVVIIIVLILGSAASRAVLNRANVNADAPIFSSTYVLDTTKNDDLFVIADEAYLASHSYVMADTSVIGRGLIHMDGRIDGDVTFIGGDIVLGPTAQIKGNAIFIGNKVTVSGQVTGNFRVISQNLTIDPTAKFTGDTNICTTRGTIANANPSLGTKMCGVNEMMAWQSLREGRLATNIIYGDGFSFGSFVFTSLLALGLAGLSGLVVTVFPRRFGQMMQAVRSLPARAIRIGCLTQGLAVAVVAGLGIIIAVLPPLGLALLPILALLLLPLGILFAVGWMTIALLVGDWLLRGFIRRTSLPMLSTIAGSLGLFVIWTLLGSLPFGPVLSGLMVLLIGAVGLGAVIMTRVGTRSGAHSYFVQG